MSKIVKVIGIIIAENIVSDSDKMLTILTSEFGKINAIAKRSRSTKSSLLPGTQFLCVSNFTLYKASTTYRVNEAIPIEMFYDIYQDYDKLLLATKITKVINSVSLENHFEHNSFKLFLLTLQLISSNNEVDKKNFKSNVFIESVFKLRLLSQLGFAPELNKALEMVKEKEEADQKKYYEIIFDIDDNKILVLDENIKIRNSIRIQKETLYSLQYIFNSNIEKIYGFNISDRILVELSRVSEKYFERCLY